MHPPPALLQLAFRPFFLLGSLFSTISLLLWGGEVLGVLDLGVYGGSLWWHGHEMLFGFVSAIVVGFLLTAVQTWTGIPGIRGGYLMVLVLLWLAGRLVLYFPWWLPAWLVAALDLSFLPLAAIVLALPVLRVRQWRNILFVPILLSMTAANAAMHWSVLAADLRFQLLASNVMVLLVVFLIGVVAGRVIPMFTANGTQTARVPAVGWLEHASILSMLLVLVLVVGMDALELPASVAAACFFLAALTHAVRALRWKIWITFRTPLVWSLHLAYWCMPVGLVLYGLSFVTSLVTHSQAVHALTVGAIGMMILAMISRVSLGHTGRNLVVGRAMTTAFIAVFGAFLVRVFGVYWPENYAQIIGASIILWLIAYGSFFVIYLPLLSRPRPDGRPG